MSLELKPRQCMTTKGAPAAATTGIIAGSARPPLTSLTRAAPAASGLFGDGGAHGVDGDGDALGGEAADDGDDAAQLLGLVDAGGAGPGGLAADVDQVGALGDQVEAVLDGGRRCRTSGRRRRRSRA